MTTSAPGGAAGDRVADREAEHAEEEDDEQRQQQRVPLVRRDLAVEGRPGAGHGVRIRVAPRSGQARRLRSTFGTALGLGLGVEEVALDEADMPAISTAGNVWMSVL